MDCLGFDNFWEEEEADETEDNMLSVMESAMNIVLHYKNIVDRGYFTTHYNKNDLKLQLSKTLINSPDCPDEGFSVFSWTSRNGKSLCKQDILNTINGAGVVNAIEVICSCFFKYCRYEINEGKLEKNGKILFTIADKIVACINSYQRAKVSSMETISNAVNEFISYLIENIANMTAESLNNKQPNFYNIHRILILKFKHLYNVQTTVIHDVTQKFISLSKYIVSSNIKQLNAINCEIFGITLNIITEVLEVSLSHSIIVEDNDVYEIKHKDLYDALNKIRNHVPDYLDEPAEETMDMLV